MVKISKMAKKMPKVKTNSPKEKSKAKVDRAPRAKTSYPKLYDLYCDAEAIILSHKEGLKFSWDGACYSKSSRNCRPDPFSLVDHAVFLEVLAKHAPTGYPSWATLKVLFVQLHKYYQIFEEASKSLGDAFNEEEVAGEAADQWRLMLKHCLEIAGSKKVPRALELTCFILVQGPDEHECMEDPTVVQYAGFFCSCPDCLDDVSIRPLHKNASHQTERSNSHFCNLHVAFSRSNFFFV